MKPPRSSNNAHQCDKERSQCGTMTFRLNGYRKKMGYPANRYLSSDRAWARRTAVLLYQAVQEL